MFKCCRFFNCFTQKDRAHFSSNKVGILGAPFNKGQQKDGVDRAPNALRKYGLIEQLQELGVDVKDYGNLIFEDVVDTVSTENIQSPSSVGAACKEVSKAVKDILSEDRKCITIGGDHSLAMGTVYGHSRVHDLCLLWVDAHADINTTQTSSSGNIHGMPCSFLVQELQDYNRRLQGFEWLNPCLKKANLAYIGLRDIDPLEKLILTKEKIVHFTMRDIDKLGIFEVTKRALKAINPSGKLSLHVSFDVDSIDKSIVPSTGTPVSGGLTLREALCIAEEIHELDYFRGLDIVEVNPMLGSEEQATESIHVAALLIKAFVGHSRQGSLPNKTQEIPSA